MEMKYRQDLKIAARAAAPAWASPESGVLLAAFGDVNRDGKADLAVADRQTRQAAVYLGTVEFPGYYFSGIEGVHDFNGDKLPDFLRQGSLTLRRGGV